MFPWSSMTFLEPALKQAVDVLGYHGAELAHPLQLGEGVVGPVGFCLQDQVRALEHEEPKGFGEELKGLYRREARVYALP